MRLGLEEPQRAALQEHAQSAQGAPHLQGALYTFHQNRTILLVLNRQVLVYSSILVTPISPIRPTFDKSKRHDLMVMRAVRVLCVILTSWFLAFFSSKNEVSSWSTAFKRYVFLQQAASKLMVTFDKNVCHQHQTGPSPTKGWFKEGPIQTLKLYLEREIKAGVLCLW